MNLGELLEHVGSYLDDRGQNLVSGDPDEIWPDELLTRFLNQGQRILARRAWCIIDAGHPQAGVVVLKTDVPSYALHKSVLRVLQAVPEDQEQPLGRFSELALRVPNPGAFDDEFRDVFANPAWDSAGRPIGFATDAGSRTMRVYRTPSSDENGLKLLLKVARLPVEWLDLNNPDGEPEVPEDYHLDIADYAAGRCLLMPNVDGQGKTDGRELLKMFDTAVWEARHDRQRAEMHSSAWNFASSTAVLNERIR